MITKIYVLTNNLQYEYPESIYQTLPATSISIDATSMIPNWIHALSFICEKKDQEEIVGLCSNGQFFTKYNSILAENYIQEVMNSYDLILPYSAKVKSKTLLLQYLDLFGNTDLLSFIENQFLSHTSDYLTSYKTVLASNQLTVGGMMIGHRKNLTSFLHWISELSDNQYFEISAFDQFLMNSKTSSRLVNPKAYDFLFEILLRTWCLHSTLAIKEETIQAKNSDALMLNIRKSELIYQFLHSRETALIDFHKRNGFTDTIIPEFTCQDDFDGKIPVWVCWWQGIDNLPPIVNACLESLKRNLPANKTCLRIITLENCGEYVTFNASIIEKFNEEKISFTHLAEALRSELLYRYGGMWIDATYYVSHPIPEEFFDQDFYTVAFSAPLFGPDISMARWSTSFWYAKAGNPLMQFIAEEIQYYWEQENEVIDYFIMDYEVAVAYNEFPELKKMIDECPKSSPSVYTLQLKMNQTLTTKEIQRLKTESLFYKINRRYEYQTKNSLGGPTVFGYLCNPSLSISDFEGTYELTSDSSKTIIDLIRETNAEKILDCTGYFVSNAAISQQSLPDCLLHPYQIDLLWENQIALQPVVTKIYNHIYTKEQILSEYSLTNMTHDVIIINKQNESELNFLINHASHIIHT